MSRRKEEFYKFIRQPRTFTFYKYMEVKWLAEFIKKDIIKATELAKVNDPLEWRPQFNNKIQEETWDKQPSSHIHVLCLSSKISTTAMWGHYADKHAGVCLAFSIPLHVHDDELNIRHQLSPEARCYPIKRLKKNNNWFMKVTYTNIRPKFDINDISSTNYRLVTNKGSDWEYESEYRILLNNGISYKKDGTPVYRGMRKFLSGIILGVKSSHETEELVKKIIDEACLKIPIVRAKLHLYNYSIIAPPFEDANTAEIDNWTLDFLSTNSTDC
ncbi:MAG: DUF2971 domain-containing protein [Akkermansia sp.]|nr:DUF2971 domain-containing protein [Akkermansia sp.]